MLVLGGCRSGKSSFTERLAVEHYRKRYLLATLEIQDDPEMRRRVMLHRKMRGDAWINIEEPLALVETLQKYQHEADVIVVDCLTMWITNMICRDIMDRDIEKEIVRLAEALGDLEVAVFMVANEVGLGIVPDSSLGRRFRDLAGWANQQLATACDEVVFMAAGFPIQLKKER